MRIALLLVFYFLSTTPSHAQTASPTPFPSFASSSQVPMLPLELDDWQFVFNALRGATGQNHESNWKSCYSSFDDPCSFITTNCVAPTRIVCDANKRIIEIVLADNNLVGNLPESALQTLGRNLRLLDLTRNPGLILVNGRECAQLDFCFRNGVTCKLDSNIPLCPVMTLSPSVNPPMNPSDAYLFNLMYVTLGLPALPQGQQLPVHCPYSPYITCVLSNGELYISEINLHGLNLHGFFPYEEATLGYLSKLTRFDISNNAMDLEWNDDDCFRFDACLPEGTVQCNFENSGMQLCEAPALPLPSSNAQLVISDELLAYWQWFYRELHLETLHSECYEPDWLKTNPCAACPARIVCSPGQGSGLLVFRTISLHNAQLRGNISAEPLQRFFDLGLQSISIASTVPELANVVGNANSTAQCMDMPPCATGAKQCDFENQIHICNQQTLAPTAVTRSPTKRPTLQEGGEVASRCGTTTGGFVPEGTRCAVPFTYASVQYRSCLSFAEFPPLMDSVQPIPEPRVPTDLWCPTVTTYNAMTAYSWGYCDCFRDDVITNTPTTLAPSAQFSSIPTVLPTTGQPVVPSPSTPLPTSKQPTIRPTSTQPSKLPTRLPSTSPSSRPTTRQPIIVSQRPTSTVTTPTTRSNRLPQQELQAWANIYDALQGNAWKNCAALRNEPCDCSGVTCETANSGKKRRRLQESNNNNNAHITEIILPNNQMSGVLDGQDLATLSKLTKLNLEGNAITLNAATTCNGVCTSSLSMCKIGTVCGGGESEVDVVPIIVGVVVGVVVLCCLLLFCYKCRDRRPTTTALSKKAKQDKRSSMTLMNAANFPQDDAPINPAFAIMVGKASTTTTGSEQQLVSGTSHFSALRTDVEANLTLEEAKIAAMKLDDAARRDVPNAESFLENLDLARHISGLRSVSPTGKLDILDLFKITDSQQREIGMTMGERVRLKRALDIRKGLINDPVFGANSV